MYSFEQMMRFSKNSNTNSARECASKGVKVDKVEKHLIKDSKKHGVAQATTNVTSDDKVDKSELDVKGEKTLGVQCSKKVLTTKMGKFVPPKVVKKDGPKPSDNKDQSNLQKLQYFDNKQVNKNKDFPIRVVETSLENKSLAMIETKIDNKPDQSQNNLVANITSSDAKLDTTKASVMNQPVLGITNATDASISEYKVINEATKKLYECGRCQQSFSYLKRYNDHQLKDECFVFIICAQCNVNLKGVKALKRHIRKQHTKALFQCDECSKIFKAQTAVNKHIRSYHLPSQCKFCKKLLKNANSRRSHANRCKVRKAGAAQTSIENKDKNDMVGENTASSDETKAENNIVTSTLNGPRTKESEAKDQSLNVTGYSEKCSLCEKILHSKSGMYKHKKTHKLMKVNGNESTIEWMSLDAEMVNTLAEMDENTNIIMQLDNFAADAGADD